jgi:hypothetical protein
MPSLSTATTNFAELLRAAFAADSAAPPCFFWAHCGRHATLEKAGRSVCRPCSAVLHGTEYPLRNPCAEALYPSDRVAAEALDMVEERAEPGSASRIAEEFNFED